MRSRADDTSGLAPPSLDDPSGVVLASVRCAQPTWISDRLPHYAECAPRRAGLPSVRVAEHAGRHIRITTTHSIEIDGRPVRLHMHVGNDGLFRCNATPYADYASAMDLVRTLIDRFPRAFDGSAREHPS